MGAIDGAPTPIAWPQGALGDDMKKKVSEARVLVVGAGGIGCELLKTLVLSGFRDIEVIDLDTIEVSNLNRQFLFRKQHVGESKAKIAAQAVKNMAQNVHIVAHRANVKEKRYDLDFFRKFNFVLNGLDNIDARRHVNRMCLAAGIPLVESGTAGYLGQVSVHVGGRTECFDCQPKPTPKSYAVCTIRTTPDKPIHCVIWAKDYLFPSLFGDSNEEKERIDSVGELMRRDGESPKEYAVRVFQYAFSDQINEALVGKADMWKDRAPPEAINLDDYRNEIPEVVGEHTTACDALNLPNQNTVWTTAESTAVFFESLQRLIERNSTEGPLQFDKDDDLAVELVTAAANLRSTCYHIPPQSLFDCKGMAGNIIHAIATTNAIISGLIVVEAFKLVAASGDPSACKSTFLRQDLSNRKMLVPASLETPNLRCPVCGVAMLELRVDTNAMKLADLVEYVLRGELGMVEPSLTFGRNEAAFCYEEGGDLEDDEIEAHARHLVKALVSLPAGGIVHGTVLELADQIHGLKMNVVVSHQEEWDLDVQPRRFKLVGQVPDVGTTPDGDNAGAQEEDAGFALQADGDGIILLDNVDEDVVEIVPRLKRKEGAAAAAGNDGGGTRKRRKAEAKDSDVMEVLE